jgi:hypothetical protein
MVEAIAETILPAGADDARSASVHGPLTCAVPASKPSRTAPQ